MNILCSPFIQHHSAYAHHLYRAIVLQLHFRERKTEILLGMASADWFCSTVLVSVVLAPCGEFHSLLSLVISRFFGKEGSAAVSRALNQNSVVEEKINAYQCSHVFHVTVCELCVVTLFPSAFNGWKQTRHVSFSREKQNVLGSSLSCLLSRLQL